MREPPLLEFRVGLPAWVAPFLGAFVDPLTTVAARMRLTVALARANVELGTGGPFGAAVFERESGVLISVGVNRVVPEHCSAAHAEILALALAQRRLQTYTLAAFPQALQLISSTEPCAMCLGAIAWSGVYELVTAATDADARRVGFDEGTKPRAWKRALTSNGIRVVTQVMRAEAREVLDLYRQSGGEIYNG